MPRCGNNSDGVPTVETHDDRGIADRLADHTANEAALQRAGKEAVLDHARAGLPVATWKDGKVVWLQPEEVLAILAKPERNGSAHGQHGA